jgi:hypothetical protein
MTKKGNLIGEIGDIIIDEDNLCKITGLEFVSDKPHKKAGIIPRECIITFSKNLIIVETDTEQKLLENAALLLTYADPEYKCKEDEALVDKCKEDEALVDKYKKDEALVDKYKKDEALVDKYKEDEAPDTNLGNDKLPVIDKPENYTVVNQNTDSCWNTGIIPTSNSNELKPGKTDDTDNSCGVNSGSTADNSNELKPGNAAELFVQRQKQYLTGRKATRRITDNYGRIIVDEDGIITEDVIENAKSKGKMIELVMNNRT